MLHTRVGECTPLHEVEGNSIIYICHWGAFLFEKMTLVECNYLLLFACVSSESYIWRFGSLLLCPLLYV